MNPLSAIAKFEKEKISSTGAWLILLEIQFQGITIRIVNNNEDIEWPSGSGTVWVGFPFQLGALTENNNGETPSLELKVSNVTREVQRYMEQYAGGTDATVILRVVMSEHLDLVTPELEETFSVTNTTADAYWVTFNLGPDFALTQRVPDDRYMKNFCPYKYGDLRCGVTDEVKAEYQTCNKTLANCRERKNSERFGGEPAIPGSGGLYV